MALAREADEINRQIEAALDDASLVATALPGAKLTVWTQPAPGTLEAITGAPGADARQAALSQTRRDAQFRNRRCRSSAPGVRRRHSLRVSS
jgi:hypothetical protein